MNIWVADDCWQKTGKKKRLVNQAMVDAVADKFLKTGEDNDIYDWVTNICGEEWGDRDKNELIAAEQPIDILLCDIGNDDDAKGKLGFFWRGNSYKKKRVPNSNERLLLYLDAPIYAIGESRNRKKAASPVEKIRWDRQKCCPTSGRHRRLRGALRQDLPTR